MLLKQAILLHFATFTLVKARFFDYYVIQTRQYAAICEMMCQAQGYAGLAVVSSPEMYAHAMELTETIRTSDHLGFYVGLRNVSGTHLVTWDDGTLPADDTKWVDDPNDRDFTADQIGMISFIGNFRAMSGSKKYALCGNHVNLQTEGFGSMISGWQPVGVSSILSLTTVFSYLECVLLCAQDHRCRVTEFNSDILTCRTLGPMSYTGLVINSKFHLFLRNGF